MAEGSNLRSSVMKLCIWVLLILTFGSTHATHINLPGAAPQLRLGVGTLGATVDTVTFSLLAADVGNAVRINGAPSVLIEVAAKRSGSTGPATVTLQVDSSAVLTSASSGPMPFTEFGWYSTGVFHNDVIFSGATDQEVVTSFTAGNGQTSREDTLTFFYLNDDVYPADTYTGVITFRAAMF